MVFDIVYRDYALIFLSDFFLSCSLMPSKLTIALFVIYALAFIFYAFIALVPFVFLGINLMTIDSGAMISRADGARAWILVVAIYGLIGLLIDRRRQARVARAMTKITPPPGRGN
jgi:hypothetical protein